jgi:hypothetical protein
LLSVWLATRWTQEQSWGDAASRSARMQARPISPDAPPPHPARAVIVRSIRTFRINRSVLVLWHLPAGSHYA